MISGKKKRKEKNEESTLNKQLLTYSLAAGTALALAQPANAEVVCSGPEDGTVNANRSLTVDLDGDGSWDFSFFYWTGTTYYDGNWYPGREIGMFAGRNSFVGVWPAYYGYWYEEVARLNPGTPVGPGPNWRNGYGYLNGTYYAGVEPPFTTWGPYSYGQFFGEQGCIGVRFWSNLDDAYHYGWIEYEGTGWSEHPAIAGNVIGWGYETEPNTPLEACVCEEPLPVPTLNPLGLLILAGLILAGGGVSMSRRRREEK